MSNDWIESQMEAERRWLAPGVRSHRWAKRPPVNGGVLKDRAWRSHHIFVSVCMWDTACLTYTHKHMSWSRRNTGQIHMFNHLVAAWKKKRSQSLFSIATCETRTLVCSTVLVTSVHISTIHIQMEKMKKSDLFPSMLFHSQNIQYNLFLLWWTDQPTS